MSRFIGAGLGCRKGCDADEIVALVRMALQRCSLAPNDLDALFAPAFKHGESGLTEAAAAFGLPLVLVPEAQLEAAQARTITRSERVAVLTGLGSIAEAAALAGCGPNARLVQPRLASARATCAIAETGEAP